MCVSVITRSGPTAIAVPLGERAGVFSTRALRPRRALSVRVSELQVDCGKDLGPRKLPASR
jgi:hypothetical protein